MSIGTLRGYGLLIVFSRRVWARKPTVEEEMADLAIETEPEV
jgi:hypothetical protein